MPVVGSSAGFEVTDNLPREQPQLQHWRPPKCRERVNGLIKREIGVTKEKRRRAAGGNQGARRGRLSVWSWRKQAAMLVQGMEG
jgi:hypothetical protein